MPSINPVRGTSRTEVGEAAPVLNAAKEERIAIVKANRRCVKNAVDRAWPVFAAENGIGGMTGEERFFGVCFRRAWVTWSALGF
jgi:hypothetical protein